MEFELHTLVDITESGSHRGPDKLAVSQQANYNTLIQVIGLRANPTPKKVIKTETNIVNDKLGFGSAYKGTQTYWIFKFEIDYGSTSVDELVEDFDLVPFIQSLTESVVFDTAIFNTKDKKYKNIVFKKLED